MSDIRPGEQVLIVFDDRDDVMKTIRLQNDGEIVPLEELHPEAVFGSIHTYSAVVVGSAVYVIQWRRRLFRIKPFEENPSWEYLLDSRKFHGAEPPAVALSGTIYVCGGGFERADEYRQTHERLEKMTNDCEIYNSHNRRWENIKSMQCKKRLNSMVEANGYIYSIGGIGQQPRVEDTKRVQQENGIKQESTDSHSPQSEEDPSTTWEIALSLVERYNPVSDEWQIMPPMNKTRIAPATASYNGKIYVLGGGGADENNPGLPVGFENRVYRSCVEVFDLSTNVWLMASYMMTSSRIKFRACVFGDTIYAVGGNKDGRTNVDKANLQNILDEARSEKGVEVWNKMLEEQLGSLRCNYMATVSMIVPDEEMQLS